MADPNPNLATPNAGVDLPLPHRCLRRSAKLLEDIGKSLKKFEDRFSVIRQYDLVLVRTAGDVKLVAKLQDWYDWEVRVQGINDHIANYARKSGLDVVDTVGPD